MFLIHATFLLHFCICKYLIINTIEKHVVSCSFAVFAIKSTATDNYNAM